MDRRQFAHVGVVRERDSWSGHDGWKQDQARAETKETARAGLSGSGSDDSHVGSPADGSK